MRSDLKKLNKTQIKATVELGPEDLQKYIDKAESVLSKEVDIKGFRRGKAPRDVIRKYVGQEKITSLALEIALEQSLSGVIRENSLDIINTSRLSIEKNDPTQLRYSVVLNLFPEVDLADLARIKVKRKIVNVDDKEVSEALEVIKNSRASFADKKEDETAENGDRAEVDFEVKQNGQLIEGGMSKNHPLIIGGRSFIPGFEEQLLGMKKGEVKSFSLTAPENYFQKNIAGKRLDFNVKLNEIKKVITSEVNDDFARSLGRFANLNELKLNIRDGLTEEKNITEKQKLRLEILDNIIANSKIEMPQSMVNAQLDIMVSDFDRTLHERGLELSLYLVRVGKTQEELKKDWIKEAEKQVKVALILRKLVKKLKLKATEQEIAEMVGPVVQSALLRGEISQTDTDPAKIKENIANKIENEKALDYIESRCAV